MNSDLVILSSYRHYPWGHLFQSAHWGGSGAGEGAAGGSGGWGSPLVRHRDGFYFLRSGGRRAAWPMIHQLSRFIIRVSLGCRDLCTLWDTETQRQLVRRVFSHWTLNVNTNAPLLKSVNYTTGWQEDRLCDRLKNKAALKKIPAAIPYLARSFQSCELRHSGVTSCSLFSPRSLNMAPVSPGSSSRF